MNLVSAEAGNCCVRKWCLVYRWVEQDPKEILQSVYECMDKTCEKLTQLNIDISNIKGICF